MQSISSMIKKISILGLFLFIFTHCSSDLIATAIPVEQILCIDDQYQCNNGSCISDVALCNGIDDCTEGEDEKECNLCSSQEYQCLDNQCIALENICDGVKDCRDNDDERDCVSQNENQQICPTDRFECSDGTCIPYEWVCDNIYSDCPEQEDELNCPEQETSTPTDPQPADPQPADPQPVAPQNCDGFTCNDGSCIINEWVCDGTYADCPNQEDETNCPGSNTSSPPDPQPVAPQNCDGFTCNDGSCIINEWVCDGTYADCPNQEDETNCPGSNTSSPPDPQPVAPQNCDGFTCNDGSCIINEWVCDGTYADCPNQEDETNCSGSNTSSPPDPQPIAPQNCDGFTCNDGSCIINEWVCDGTYADCPDQEDETNCSGSNTSSPPDPQPIAPQNCDGFTCNDGSCIINEWVCDGTYADCPDQEDETNCSGSNTPAPQNCNGFTCNDGSCIPAEYLCDGTYADCPDQEDETNCSGSNTPAPQNCNGFTCNDGSCIPAEYVCDGIYADCPDQEDEDLLSCVFIDLLPDFPCLDGNTIPPLNVCDGIAQCLFGEDELLCF